MCTSEHLLHTFSTYTHTQSHAIMLIYPGPQTPSLFDIFDITNRLDVSQMRCRRQRCAPCAATSSMHLQSFAGKLHSNRTARCAVRVVFNAHDTNRYAHSQIESGVASLMQWNISNIPLCNPLRVDMNERVAHKVLTHTHTIKLNFGDDKSCLSIFIDVPPSNT